MWLIVIILLGSGLNNVVAFNGGRLTTNRDDYSSMYAILRLKPKHNTTEFKPVKQWEYKCVATAISQNHVITAGHCLLEYWNAHPKESLDVYYMHQAETHMNLKDIENAIPIDVKDVKFHPNFANETCPAHDIAIIILTKNNVYSKSLTLCLHMHENLIAISLINAQKNYSHPNFVNIGTFETEAPHKCIGTTPYIKNSTSQICTTSTCHTERGDSGSPLITTTKNPCLIGILSCGTNDWTIFSNVISNSDWINNIIIPQSDSNNNATAIMVSTLNMLLTFLCSYFITNKL